MKYQIDSIHKALHHLDNRVKVLAFMIVIHIMSNKEPGDEGNSTGTEKALNVRKGCYTTTFFFLNV